MSHRKIDRRDLKKRKRYVFVGFPEVLDYADMEGFEGNSVWVQDKGEGKGGRFIEEGWLLDHTPSYSRETMSEIADAVHVFSERFDFDRNIREYHRALEKFLSEFDECSVDSVEEFADLHPDIAERLERK